VRVLQCVAPPGGVSCAVNRSTFATVPSGSHGLRPRPLAITPRRSIPVSANLARHRRTVSESTPQDRAICSFATPSAANSKALACTTVRYGNVDDFAIRVSSTRCSALTGNAGAVTKGITHITVLIHRRTTSYAVAHDEVNRRLRAAEETDETTRITLSGWEYQLGYARNRASELSLSLDIYGASPRSIDISLTAEPMGRALVTEPFWATVLGWTANGRESPFHRQDRLIGVLKAAGISYATGWATAADRDRPCLVTFEVERVQQLPINPEGQDVVILVTRELQQLRPDVGWPLQIRSLRIRPELRCPLDPRMGWEADQAEAARLAQTQHEQRLAAASRRQESRVKAARARGAMAVEHKRLADLGWPVKWTPANVTTWTGLGGTLASAQIGLAGGWTFTELHDGFGPGPSGDAKGRLPKISSGESLPPGVGVVLRVERRSPKRQRVLEVLRTPSGWLLAHDDALTNVDAQSLEDVIGACPELHRLPLGEQVSFRCPNRHLAVEAIVPLLQVTGRKISEGPAWTSDADTSEWSEDDEFIDDMAGNVAFVHRWATFNDIRLTGLRLDRVVDVVAVDLQEEQFVTLDVLAEGSWFSESGGAPISWDGGSRLARVSPRLAMTHTWGDQDPGTSIHHLARNQAKLVALVADWVLGQDFESAVAMSLEPFDPRATLPSSERAEWDELLEGLTTSAWTELSSEASKQLGRRLKRLGTNYRAVASALASPRGRLGRGLKAALIDANESGVMGAVLWFGQ
jgi:hypothetical protein